MAVDWLASLVAFAAFNYCRFFILKNQGISVIDYLFSTKLIVEEIVVPVCMLAIYWFSGYYNNPFGKSRLQELLTTMGSALINSALIYIVLLINDQTGERKINYELMLVLFGLLFIFPYLGRIAVTSLATRKFRRHNLAFRVLVIGNSGNAREVASNLEKGDSRVSYKIVGFADIPGEKSVSGAYGLSEVKDACIALDVDQVVIVPESYNEKLVLTILDMLFPLDIPIKIAPDTLSFVTSAIRLKDIYGEPFVDLTTPVLSESSKNVKRFADVVLSVLALVCLSPALLVIAVCVRRSSPGPVIYSQERIGLKQRPFRIYKFRTMRTDAEASGPRLSSDDDPRVTEVGKVMRKYRLDELPQFWNVIKGDMSIVGPRPERRYFISRIMEKAPYYALVHQVRPGITSWGMVKYGYASTIGQMVERTRYELIYMANMSLFVDMKILIYTIKTVITGKGK